eukprot:scaffold209559_cov35-Tisochrysis_lutea.AAC.1
MTFRGHRRRSCARCAHSAGNYGVERGYVMGWCSVQVLAFSDVLRRTFSLTAGRGHGRSALLERLLQFQEGCAS